MNKFANVSSVNGSIGFGEYLDRTIAHELTHCVMAANINYYAKLPQFVKEGMAELTHGTDDGSVNQEWMKKLANKSSLETTGNNKSLFDSTFDMNNTGTGIPSNYAGGYMFFRWFAKKVSGSSTVADVINNTVNNTSITTTDADKIISNSGSNVTITTGAGNDSIFNNGWNVTIDSGAGTDLISLLSAWYSTIDGDKGNDKIVSSVKDALYKYTKGDGNDIIYGFNANSTLSISGGNFSSLKSGDSIFVGVGNDTITLSGAASLSTVNILGTVKSGNAATEGNDYIKDTSNQNLSSTFFRQSPLSAVFFS